MNRCPQCNTKMRTGKNRRVGDELFRYRSCAACGHRDRAWYQPEKLIRIEPVLTRTLSADMTDSVSPLIQDSAIRRKQGEPNANSQRPLQAIPH